VEAVNQSQQNTYYLIPLFHSHHHNALVYNHLKTPHSHLISAIWNNGSVVQRTHTAARFAIGLPKFGSLTAFAYLRVVGSNHDKTHSVWVFGSESRSYQRLAVLFALSALFLQRWLAAMIE
jgi:hypothetical protein